MRLRPILSMFLEHLRNAIVLIIFATVFYSLLSVGFER